MSLTLPACRMGWDQLDLYTVEYVIHRPSGDTDVLVTAAPWRGAEPHRLGFRHDGRWQQLAGPAPRPLDEAVGWLHAELRHTTLAPGMLPLLTALIPMPEPGVGAR
ncbi:hypothetical protein Ssi03_61990 [Sphaerisporangium siamense]|uniref:Uncharacterized protein n=1 Tax=Sphaerisporangium siamense TaxID=795645 RepID=A0A7W7D925_9ACTN|nr:hypothetical protein [Sphaerisporangium siamense]MBB4702510.1 hypothetical protein [Sphaerisporangium siamense]GII88209.1 hypothetical protein Ssi03_61990 [Sphaerisporangium siamense]